MNPNQFIQVWVFGTCLLVPFHNVWKETMINTQLFTVVCPLEPLGFE